MKVHEKCNENVFHFFQYKKVVEYGETKNRERLHYEGKYKTIIRTSPSK